ncbi:unnamed protein product [Amoebophrya sp. A120]|nr:unnamed protein product [Amoebophrya sp. A120]|eukprot:GSA120T00015402001.1
MLASCASSPAGATSCPGAGATATDTVLSLREARKQRKQAKQVAKQQPGAGKCNFFLSHKARFCKFPQMEGSQFCVCHNLTTAPAAPALVVVERAPIIPGDSCSIVTTRIDPKLETVAVPNENGPRADQRQDDDDVLCQLVPEAYAEKKRDSSQARRARTRAWNFSKNGASRNRIPCPLDPTHSIYEDQLEKHVQKCSKNAQENFVKAQPCYRQGCNLLGKFENAREWRGEFRIDVKAVRNLYPDRLVQEKNFAKIKATSTCMKMDVLNGNNGRSPATSEKFSQPEDADVGAVARAREDLPLSSSSAHEGGEIASAQFSRRDAEDDHAAGAESAAKLAGMIKIHDMDLSFWLPLVHAAYRAACKMLELSCGEADALARGCHFRRGGSFTNVGTAPKPNPRKSFSAALVANNNNKSDEKVDHEQDVGTAAGFELHRQREALGEATRYTNSKDRQEGEQEQLTATSFPPAKKRRNANGAAWSDEIMNSMPQPAPEGRGPELRLEVEKQVEVLDRVAERIAVLENADGKHNQQSRSLVETFLAEGLLAGCVTCEQETNQEVKIGIEDSFGTHSLIGRSSDEEKQLLSPPKDEVVVGASTNTRAPRCHDERAGKQLKSRVTTTTGVGVPFFLEYGSGKAGLSRWLGLAFSELGGGAGAAQFFAIEREARRNKAENKLSLPITRLRLDIADFNLQQLVRKDHPHTMKPRLLNSADGTPKNPGSHKLFIENGPNANINIGKGKGEGPGINFAKMPENQRTLLQNAWRVFDNRPACSSVVVHAKHLCGGATDLALSSLECLSEDVCEEHPPTVDNSGSRSITAKVGIATCCHHRCDTKTYVAPKFLELLLREVASGCVKLRDSQIEEEQTTPSRNEDSDSSSHNIHTTACASLPLIASTTDASEGTLLSHRTITVQEFFEALLPLTSWATSDLNSAQKRFVGVKAKRILDLGRAWYCHTVLGMERARLLNYVPATTSPENAVLLAI